MPRNTSCERGQPRLRRSPSDQGAGVILASLTVVCLVCCAARDRSRYNKFLQIAHFACSLYPRERVRDHVCVPGLVSLVECGGRGRKVGDSWIGQLRNRCQFVFVVFQVLFCLCARLTPLPRRASSREAALRRRPVRLRSNSSSSTSVGSEDTQSEYKDSFQDRSKLLNKLSEKEKEATELRLKDATLRATAASSAKEARVDVALFLCDLFEFVVRSSLTDQPANEHTHEQHSLSPNIATSPDWDTEEGRRALHWNTLPRTRIQTIVASGRDPIPGATCLAKYLDSARLG